MNFNISKQNLQTGMDTMNACGIRLTGSKAHNDFINYLQDEIKKLGVKIYSDPFYFRRWEEKNSSIEILGEGENVNIPEISLVPAPYYLCVVSDSNEMEKFDIDLMTEQTETFAKLIEKIEKIDSAQLGRSDMYSIIKAKSVSGGYDFSLSGLKSKILSKR